MVGDFACADNEDFVLENGAQGLPLCVPKVVNAGVDPATSGRRRGGSTTNVRMCFPCAPGKFKVNVGNEECLDSCPCPLNQETEPGEWKVEQNKVSQKVQIGYIVLGAFWSFQFFFDVSFPCFYILSGFRLPD